MRRALILIVPALLLVGLVLLQRTVPQWRHTVVSAAPGEVLYAVTFDGGATDGFNTDWEQSEGRLSAEVVDGAMRVGVGEVISGVYSVADPYFADFDLTVQGRAVEGPEDNGFGVVFRLQDQDNDSTRDDSYYLFLISSDGYYQVTRSVNGVEKILSDWAESDAITVGIDALNTLRVRAQGNTFQFYVNDQQLGLCIPDNPEGISTFMMGECIGGSMVQTLTDDSIPNGRIGVGARTTETGDSGVIVEFDNLVVVSPTSDGASASA